MSTDELPKVKVYWLNESRAQRILWLLEELKVPYDVELFHRTKENLAPPELTKIHPLGKSPVIELTPPGSHEPMVLAESGFMMNYLCEHLPEGHKLMPQRWKPGMEGKLGGETDAFLRYQYYMYYCEGSLMPLLVMTLVIGILRSPTVPFFIRPITSIVAGRIFAAFIYPGIRKHFTMLEQHLETSPGGGKYLCGDHLTAADIIMSYPLIAARGRLNEIGEWEGGCWTREFSRLGAYTDMLENEEGYKTSVRKVEEIEGKPQASL